MPVNPLFDDEDLNEEVLEDEEESDEDGESSGETESATSTTPTRGGRNPLADFDDDEVDDEEDDEEDGSSKSKGTRDKKKSGKKTDSRKSARPKLFRAFSPAMKLYVHREFGRHIFPHMSDEEVDAALSSIVDCMLLEYPSLRKAEGYHLSKKRSLQGKPLVKEYVVEAWKSLETKASDREERIKQKRERAWFTIAKQTDRLPEAAAPTPTTAPATSNTVTPQSKPSGGNTAAGFFMGVSTVLLIIIALLVAKMNGIF